MKKQTNSGNGRLAVAAGAYSIVATLLILGMLVLTNMIFAEIPQSWTVIDVSMEKLYSLSDQTRQIMESINGDITLYWITEKGKEDESIEILLKRYEELSPHVKVMCVNISENENWVKKYTAANLSVNSVIVEMENRYMVVDYSTIYAYDVDNYYLTGEYETYFDGEAVITSAIGYVSSQTVSRLYVLTGHGEPTATSYIAEKIERDGIELVPYSLMSGAAVPDDADAVLVYNPSTDYAKIEVEMLISYVERGGALILVTDFAGAELPNFRCMAEYYGVKSVGGVIVEENTELYAWGRPYYLFPILQSHAITNALKNRNYKILAPNASGFTVAETLRSSLTITPLLTSSDNSYMENNALELEKSGNQKGPFLIGVLIQELVDTTQGTIIWYSSGEMFAEDIDEMVSGANSDLLCNSLAFLVDSESRISIRSKSTMPDLLQITASQGNTIAVLLIAVFPAAYIIPGVVISIKRRQMR